MCEGSPLQFETPVTPGYAGFVAIPDGAQYTACIEFRVRHPPDPARRRGGTASNLVELHMMKKALFAAVAAVLGMVAVSAFAGENSSAVTGGIGGFVTGGYTASAVSGGYTSPLTGPGN